jgi:hypothetical protein
VAAEAYCVKCKTKRQIKDAVQITMKNGRPATQGKCPECGTKMFKIGADVPAEVMCSNGPPGVPGGLLRLPPVVPYNTITHYIWDWSAAPDLSNLSQERDARR